jgi:hypothetical protein
MKTTVTTCAALLCAIAAVTLLRSPRPASATSARLPDLVREIRVYQRQTWHWQSVRGAAKTRAAQTPPAKASADYQLWVRNLWRRRALAERRIALRPPHRAEWQCIHRYEGAWDARTGNGYYGGLQMDISFQRHYAGRLLRRKGTADHWTPLEQMWAAEHAHRSGLGFTPWPNTARFCGLI